MEFDDVGLQSQAGAQFGPLPKNDGSVRGESLADSLKAQWKCFYLLAAHQTSRRPPITFPLHYSLIPDVFTQARAVLALLSALAESFRKETAAFLAV